jgi:hypothetical protein
MTSSPFFLLKRAAQAGSALHEQQQQYQLHEQQLFFL